MDPGGSVGCQVFAHYLCKFEELVLQTIILHSTVSKTFSILKQNLGLAQNLWLRIQLAISKKKWNEIYIYVYLFFRSEAKDSTTNVAKFASLPLVHDGSLHWSS